MVQHMGELKHQPNQISYFSKLVTKQMEQTERESTFRDLCDSVCSFLMIELPLS